MYYKLHLHTLHFLKFRSAQNKLFYPPYPPSTFVPLYSGQLVILVLLALYLRTTRSH